MVHRGPLFQMGGKSHGSCTGEYSSQGYIHHLFTLLQCLRWSWSIPVLRHPLSDFFPASKTISFQGQNIPLILGKTCAESYCLEGASSQLLHTSVRNALLSFLFFSISGML